ncbi:MULTISPECIES: magnesium transporter CorA family protein [unclassified Mycolicibacterium]|uniref:magnesium transporter CorA family protein n=1 Tax=unclassified Mycolicibacterium TaxID=2636767 RepID=UPI00130BF85D|nr:MULTISPECIES: magnesium transporter CorA family protein [unclassified Mycolicibacterium]MUL82808.1 magnesium transporter CorA family protein [Mycolicibacterium sp. CBMA 329]MUL89143.1 magnesium transporter CorA family protein [Mycolicibacterium sp. CBMA 331]MUL97710.1 magnesium transporter CorA family protein [Mycolicibacterium sp. CBMA 334]MUM29748.1 magnesium transporter CorA family protein [Mycolicibacterium sp. CBMA 295]MUM38659.1 magnesium transporter CorA family protein [Mycolicibacte
MKQVQGRVWRSGQPVDDGFTFSAISECLADEHTLMWADIYDPDHDALRELAEELGLNMWAVEDAVAPKERTKASVYHTHTFFTVYAVDIRKPDEEAAPYTSLLVRHRISAFVLPRGLITVRLPSLNGAATEFDMSEVSRRFDELGGQRYGVGSLVHGLLDVVVDGHFEAVEALDDAIESLEDELFADGGPQRGLQRRTFTLRKDLVELRRVVLPMREVVSTIQHRRLDSPTSPELDPLYADLYDHVLRASEWTESLRDMVTTVFETNLSLQDARLNTVMKKLTGWAAIIAVPTAITGFYGQNVIYPGINTVVGFIASTALIMVLVILLYVMFKRRDWL